LLARLLSFVWPTTLPVEVAAVAPEVAAAEIAVRAARPEDAEPIAQLLYENHRLSYLQLDFYRPRWLREDSSRAVWCGGPRGDRPSRLGT
jgi:hypothetical protein